MKKLKLTKIIVKTPPSKAVQKPTYSKGYTWVN